MRHLLIDSRIIPSGFERAPLGDAELDYWGETYLANPRIQAAGITFEAFLRAPHETFDALVWTQEASAQALRPLLPRQRRVLERLATEERCGNSDASELRGYRLRNGALVEPLHHRFWPRRSPPRPRAPGARVLRARRWQTQ